MARRSSLGLKIAGIAFLVSSAPLAFSLLASLAGAVFDCSVNEAGASPCLVGGADIGGALATMFLAGWYSVVILPIAGPILILGIVLAVIERRKRA
jgi:hypothetical protein